MIGMCCDLHLSLPLAIDLLCQTGHAPQVFGVEIDQGKLAAAQLFIFKQRTEGVQPETGTARTDDDDF
jgi:hypothetical protein